MNDLFIPPEGAMQFEITHTRMPGWEVVVGTAIWVIPHTPHSIAMRHCECVDGWDIVRGSVPEELWNKMPMIPWVCKCNGHLIE